MTAVSLGEAGNGAGWLPTKIFITWLYKHYFKTKLITSDGCVEIMSDDRSKLLSQRLPLASAKVQPIGDS